MTFAVQALCLELNQHSTFNPSLPEGQCAATPNSIFGTAPSYSLNPFGNSYNSSNFLNNYAPNYAEKFKQNTKTISNLPSGTLKALGYNAEKGQKLANIAIKNTVGFTGKCATYAKNDIKQAGLGEYEPGHAFQCDDILRRNPNFKEISTAGLDLKKLPAGCVLVYERGVAGYSSTYGHIEITDGQGSARSDGKTNNIRPGAKVFIPV